MINKIYGSLRKVGKRIAEYVNNTLADLEYGMRILVADDQYTPLEAIIIDSVKEDERG